jgi:hypothetical protein
MKFIDVFTILKCHICSQIQWYQDYCRIYSWKQYKINKNASYLRKTAAPVQDAPVTANTDELDANQLPHLAPIHAIEQQPKIVQLRISATWVAGTPAAGNQRCPCVGRGRTSGGDARRGGVELGAGGCPTRRGLDSGHSQRAGLGKKSAEVTVVTDEAAGGGWGTGGGGFCGRGGFSPQTLRLDFNQAGQSEARREVSGGEGGRGGLGAVRRTLAAHRRWRGRRWNLSRAHGNFRSSAVATSWTPAQPHRRHHHTAHGGKATCTSGIGIHF